MKRPNILIITTDQQRGDALGAAGNTEIKTPNLDALAAGGTNFARHFVQNAVCMPSRLSFLTGQYPSTLKITHMAVPVPQDTITLPHMLRNYGYTSANIGKLHFLPHANRDHREPHPAYGFDHLEISDEPGSYEDAYRAWVRAKAPDELDKISVGLPPATKTWQETMGVRDDIVHADRGGDLLQGAFPGRSDVTHSTFVAEQTMEFIRNNAGGPFMCVAGFYWPHAPFVAPQEFLDLYDPAELSLPEMPPEINAKRAAHERLNDDTLRRIKQAYYAMVSEVDHHVGRILACLDELGLADDTIVVFTSDHGEWLGEHLRLGKGYPAHDCVSNVPLLIRYPRSITAPGGTVEGIVEALDVIPTLLQWAGIPIPQHLQGRPLQGMIDGDADGRTSALTEMTGVKILRMESLRYIAHADGREELYDLAKPLGEYTDVAAEDAYADALADARAELIRHLIDMERPMPRTWPY